MKVFVCRTAIFLPKHSLSSPDYERTVTVFNRTVENYVKKASSSSETLRQHTSYALCTLSVQLALLLIHSSHASLFFAPIFSEMKITKPFWETFSRRTRFEHCG
jgi:hypothetical protein